MRFRVCEWSKATKFPTHPGTWDFKTLEDATNFLNEHGYLPTVGGWDRKNATALIIVMGE